MSWTNDHISLMIQEYEKYPQLYCITHPQYFNKTRRNVYLDRIALVLNKIRPNTTGIDVQKKLSGLRNTYTSERRKYLKSLKNADEGLVYTPSLWYYEKLEFLNAHLGTRKAKSNLSISKQPEFVNMPEENNSKDTDFDSTSEEELKFPADPFIEEAVTLQQDIVTTEVAVPTPTRKRIRYTEEAQPSTDVKHPTSTQQPIDYDLVYCKYFASRLACIKNYRRKLRVQHEIDNLLHEAIMEELS